MADGHESYKAGLDDPYENVVLVTKSDSTVLPTTRGISVAVAGDLAVLTKGGQSVVIPGDALVAGVIHRLRVTKVLSTGTAATGIVAYY